VNLRPAIFFDRDGVINVFPGPGKFVLSRDMFTLMPGVPEQLWRLKQRGFFLALITNQSGVGRGLMSLDDLHAIHQRMHQQLGESAIDALYYCSHHPDDGCVCRKPSPEMILRACAEHQLSPRDSFMIGDSGRDIEMGRAAGCTTILCRELLPSKENLKPAHVPDYMFKTLPEAVDLILQKTTDDLPQRTQRARRTAMGNNKR